MDDQVGRMRKRMKNLFSVAHDMVILLFQKTQFICCEKELKPDREKFQRYQEKNHEAYNNERKETPICNNDNIYK